MRFIILAFFFACGLTLRAQVAPGQYKIYDTRRARVVDMAQLLKNVQTADVVFFGEEHHDSIGHLLEQQLFAGLAAKWPRTALSMEMFHTDAQVVMDEYLLGLISEKNFQRDARVWSNYTDYRPMIEFAKISKLPVLAANTPTRYSNAVTMRGLGALEGFPGKSRELLPPLPIDTARGPYYEKFQAELGGHGMGSMKVYQTQNLWDSSMAWSVAGFLKKNPGYKVLHLNGRFHSDQQLGVFARLLAYAPRLKLLNISCFAAADFEQPDWKKYAALADFVILTDPAAKKSF
ncbi:hypothetical protein C7T94_15280 [Pedobacter yulinensis]|uniref:Haem-binding uptake Tiki superfamily ChaN domain-containing protein n=1 Tax=Pedobacter yulinensis TaxID=2126353 RepID=A0A2T3HID3_9SPHI|nr:ChaN family lipoprotein [Pedobacter yulinensis]PST82163.1 hypothetical protein C7T94_15280 [Pedobacter yulinensis]